LGLVHGKKKGGTKKWPRQDLDWFTRGGRDLSFGLSLWETDSALSFFPVATLFHKLDALKALHD
jgi:hypothetical protein